MNRNTRGHLDAEKVKARFKVLNPDQVLRLLNGEGDPNEYAGDSWGEGQQADENKIGKKREREIAFGARTDEPNIDEILNQLK